MAGYVDEKSDDHGISDPETVKQILQEHHKENHYDSPYKRKDSYQFF